MIKIFSILLSVLMLSFSVIPCEDEIVYDDNNVEMHCSDDNKQDNHSDKDNCSPFCVCQCCQIHIAFSIPFFKKIIIDRSVEEKTEIYQNLYEKDTFFLVWNPPKLS